jgi:hypothetical protein
MDFSIFDRLEHMTALAWLGKRPWLAYKDFPEQRSISAGPKKVLFKPKKPEEYPDAICVGEKEFNRHPAEMWTTLREILNVLEFDIIGSLWYDTLAKALAGGPKIFRPTPEQCEALQHAEAQYSFKDYRQPFPVIILEIPPAYKEMLKEKYGIEESPQYVLVNHDERNSFITVSAFYNKSNIITHITPDRVEYATIEESLKQNRDRRRDNTQHLPDSENEFNAAENVQRLGVNFAMMMSLYSVKVTGPIDPNNYKMWEKESTSKRNNGEFTRAAKEAQANLAAAMHQIQFNQQVSFYDEIEEHIEIAQGVDIGKLHRSPRSHWRRGHFAMQACGIGHRDRKMIFRKPLLVRANYFFGDVKDAAVTYTMHPGRDNPAPPQPAEQLTHTPINMPEPEPGLKVGQQIEVVSVEDSPVQPGTKGRILKIKKLGSDITQIIAMTEDTRFTLLCPPDQFKVL